MVDDIGFDATAVDEALVRNLAASGFLDHQRNVVLAGGTRTGKTQLAIAFARPCIRDGTGDRFVNVVDHVNRLEAEARSGRRAAWPNTSPR